MMRRFLRRALRQFIGSERAVAAAEFVIGFPVVFLSFLVVIELTILMARSTLLQQSLEVTMREVRLGNMVNPSVLALEADICDRITLFDKCKESLTLEFTRVDPATFAMPGQQAPCVRRTPEVMAGRASENYQTGVPNELMVVRACVVADAITPVMPTTFEIFARTAFVNEPQD